MTRTADGAGGWTEAWANISGAATRCRFKAVSGGERIASERLQGTTRNRLVCRYFAGLDERDRVSVGGRKYNIAFVNDIDLKGRWFEIDLDGGVAA